jgi:hypothetical protein
MKITVQILLDPEDGSAPTACPITTLERAELTPASAGLHLAEAPQVLTGLQQHLLAAQAAAALAAQTTCGRHAGKGSKLDTDTCGPAASRSASTDAAQRPVVDRCTCGYPLPAAELPQFKGLSRPKSRPRPPTGNQALTQALTPTGTPTGTQVQGPYTTPGMEFLPDPGTNPYMNSHRKPGTAPIHHSGIHVLLDPGTDSDPDVLTEFLQEQRVGAPALVPVC